MTKTGLYSLKGKRVLIFQQRGWAMRVGRFLAQKLHEEGALLGAFTVKKSVEEFVRAQQEVPYAYIIPSDDIKSDPESYLNGARYPLAEICKELGIDSIWPLVAGARNHVRSYGEKYYFGFKQNVSDEDIVLYVQAIYHALQKLWKEFPPDIIVTPNFATLHHLMFYHFAKQRGVRMLAMTDSKVSGVYIFSHDYNYSTGRFFDRIEELEKGAETNNRERAKNYIAEFRKNFKAPEGMEFWNPRNKKRSLLVRLKHALSPYYQILKWYTTPQKNHWKMIGASLDYRPPRIILRDHYAYERYKKAANRFPYYPFEKLDKFAYFPLQVQPEEAIDIIAPYMANQLETARQIAMSLPDDYTLVVREHPYMVGMRTPSYLEKLARTPNVKLIDYRIPNETVMRRASLLICPGGTSVAEAAMLQKPVIQLGNLGTTRIFPNVVQHTHMATLAPAIKKVLAEKPREDYERRLEAIVAAAYDVGFEGNYIGLWERDDAKEIRESLWNAYQTEIKRILHG